MVYVMGDNDLEPFAVDDLLEMSRVGSTDDVNVVSLVDRHPAYFVDDDPLENFEDTKLLVVQDGDLSQSTDVGEVNVGDPRPSPTSSPAASPSIRPSGTPSCSGTTPPAGPAWVRTRPTATTSSTWPRSTPPSSKGSPRRASTRSTSSASTPASWRRTRSRRPWPITPGSCWPPRNSNPDTAGTTRPSRCCSTSPTPPPSNSARASSTDSPPRPPSSSRTQRSPCRCST